MAQFTARDNANPAAPWSAISHHSYLAIQRKLTTYLALPYIEGHQVVALRDQLNAAIAERGKADR